MESLALSLVIISSIFVSIATTIYLKKKHAKDTNNKHRNRGKPSRTLAVLGSGGHTSEMIRLLSSLNNDNFTPISYVVASTDTTSINRLTAICNQKSAEKSHDHNKDKSSSETKRQRHLTPPHHDQIYIIPRAREVGQSYITSIFTTIVSILSSAHVIWKTRPDILIINGPGTCLPIAFWTFIGRFLGICEGKIVFCESFCRVTSLSLTGQILMKLGLVDLFLVHWQELMDVINSDYDVVVKKHGLKVVLIDSFITHQ